MLSNTFSLRLILLMATTTMFILTKTITTRVFGFGNSRIMVEGFAWNRYNQRQALSESLRTRSMLFSSTTSTTESSSSNSRSDKPSGSEPVVVSTNERLFSEEINVLYDSKCGVCKLEMEWLVSRDIKLNGPNNRKLKLTDLEDENFDSSDPSNGSIDYDTGMAAIYAIKHDGTVHKGVPVFELAYDQVGLGWIWKINQIKMVNRFLEWGYEIFAKNRTIITRGTRLETLLALNASKKKALAEDDCESCSKMIDGTKQ